MKHLLITILTFVSSAAFAGNGAGTMGLTSEKLNAFDFGQAELIKFEAVDGDRIELSRLTSLLESGELEIESLTISARDLPLSWKKAVRASQKSAAWELAPVDPE